VHALDLSRLSVEFWSWRLWAACRQADRDLFFSPDGERGLAKRRRERAAKAICASCPVREDCAFYAIGNHERYGVWGGLSEHERELIWRDLSPVRQRPGRGRRPRVLSPLRGAVRSHADDPAIGGGAAGLGVQSARTLGERTKDRGRGLLDRGGVIDESLRSALGCFLPLPVRSMQVRQRQPKHPGVLASLSTRPR